MLPLLLNGHPTHLGAGTWSRMARARRRMGLPACLAFQGLGAVMLGMPSLALGQGRTPHGRSRPTGHASAVEAARGGARPDPRRPPARSVRRGAVGAAPDTACDRGAGWQTAHVGGGSPGLKRRHAEQRLRLRKQGAAKGCPPAHAAPVADAGAGSTPTAIPPDVTRAAPVATASAGGSLPGPVTGGRPSGFTMPAWPGVLGGILGGVALIGATHGGSQGPEAMPLPPATPGPVAPPPPVGPPSPPDLPPVIPPGLPPDTPTTTVPEPGPIWLVGAGGLLLVGIGRRRGERQASRPDPTTPRAVSPGTEPADP